MLVVLAVREVIAGLLALAAVVAGTVLDLGAERVTAVSTAIVSAGGVGGLVERVVEATAPFLVGLTGLTIARRVLRSVRGPGSDVTGTSLALDGRTAPARPSVRPSTARRA